MPCEMMTISKRSRLYGVSKSTGMSLAISLVYNDLEVRDRCQEKQNAVCDRRGHDPVCGRVAMRWPHVEAV